MDVVAEVGGWEHECCGPSIERDQVVDFECLFITKPGAQPRLIGTHHELETFQPTERIRGRVVDIDVVLDDGSAQSILRVPSGGALRGFEEDDDGPWRSVDWGDRDFGAAQQLRVTVRVPGRRLQDPLLVYRT